MAVNKIAKVAELLGVEMNRIFKIVDDKGETLLLNFWFSERGLEYATKGSKIGTIAEDILRYLLIGVFKIKKQPWEPRKGDDYYIPVTYNAPYHNLYNKRSYQQDATGIYDYTHGFCCKTEEQAENLAKLLIRTARKFQGFDDELEEKDYELEEKQE